MFSIVCVYNKKTVFENVLQKSLLRQRAEYELIAIDNSKNKYSSVAAAMNSASEKVNGKYLMFVHQDVEFGSDDWLSKVEKILESIGDFGVAGVAGASQFGGKKFESHLVGNIKSGNKEWGRALSGPIQVQTVDELLIMVPRSVFLENKFDEKSFDFIHLFASDLCLSLGKRGYKTYVVPGYVWHLSTGYFFGIDRYRIKLFLKHIKCTPIFTTCGEISFRTMPKIILISLLPKKSALFFRNLRSAIFKRGVRGDGLYQHQSHE